MMFDWNLCGTLGLGANPPVPAWYADLGFDQDGMAWRVKVEDLKFEIPNTRGRYILKFDCFDPDDGADPYIQFRLGNEFQKDLKVSEYWEEVEERFSAIYCDYDQIADRVMEFMGRHNIAD